MSKHNTNEFLGQQAAKAIELAHALQLEEGMAGVNAIQGMEQSMAEVDAQAQAQMTEFLATQLAQAEELKTNLGFKANLDGLRTTENLNQAMAQVGEEAQHAATQMKDSVATVGMFSQPKAQLSEEAIAEAAAPSAAPSA